MLIETGILTVLGTVANVAGLHGWFTGLRHGDLARQALRVAEETKMEIEQLSTKLHYDRNTIEVIDTDKVSGEIANIQDAKFLLEPLKTNLYEEIYATAIKRAPDKLIKIFDDDPRNFLLSIQPADRPTPAPERAMVPILFEFMGSQFIGWQKKASLPSLFNTQFDENTGLFRDRESLIIGQRTSETKQPEELEEEKEAARKAAEAKKMEEKEAGGKAAKAKKLQEKEAARKAAEAKKSEGVETARRAAEAKKSEEIEIARKAAEAKKSEEKGRSNWVNWLVFLLPVILFGLAVFLSYVFRSI